MGTNEFLNILIKIQQKGDHCSTLITPTDQSAWPSAACFSPPRCTSAQPPSAWGSCEVAAPRRRALIGWASKNIWLPLLAPDWLIKVVSIVYNNLRNKSQIVSSALYLEDLRMYYIIFKPFFIFSSVQDSKNFFVQTVKYHSIWISRFITW